MTVDNDFEKFLNEMQKKVEHDEGKIFSKTVIQEYRNPKNFGVLTKPDRSGSIKGPCGDTMRIDLKIKNGIISAARFWTDGCGPSIACGNMLTKMIFGKSIHEALKINNSQLLESLGGLPVNHQHCATLAINTLHSAIKQSDTK